MFCQLKDLTTESDVEQKLLFPLLTARAPRGLGYAVDELRTKLSLRRFQIDKGSAKKLYFPDYVVLLSGLPALVVEAKAPHEDAEEGLREARLYAQELNAIYPHGVNPCFRVISTNGQRLLSAPVDTAVPDVDLAFEHLHETDITYAKFTDLASRAALMAAVSQVQQQLRPKEYVRCLELLGGHSVQDEEIPNNTFGATIATNYRHLFNPSTREDRRFIATKAYISSTRRTQYVEPIDRIIRAAVPPSVSSSRPIEDTAAPAKVITALKRSAKLAHEVILLVGGVGAGKTTFVDYLQAVALSPDVRDKTVWLHLNMNEAPLDARLIYEWVLDKMIDEFQGHVTEEDFDRSDVWKRIFSAELNRFRNIVLDGYPPESNEVRDKMSAELERLINSRRDTVNAMIRYYCVERQKAAILVLDNCDKRTLNDQLLMFEVAQWAKAEFRCVVFLPIRDVTYDLYRGRPPLDTALKDLVFYIEPPLFSKVLARRIRLALDAMEVEYGPKRLSFTLTSGVEVEYPASDLAMYLVSITHSLFEYDRIVRRLITALAGRDVRKAMELFLEFCMSGHIAENEIWQIRATEGKHALDYQVVIRVLLRMNRRFYDGDRSYIKNLLQCVPKDALPDHFVRVAILRWLQVKFAVPGPTHVNGYHKASTLLSELLNSGHSMERTRAEMKYLVSAGCITTEHQEKDRVEESDLIAISPSGWVHLELLENVAYLGTIAEDLWFGESAAPQRIANRVGQRGTYGQYRAETLVYNAFEVSEYLKRQHAGWFKTPDKFLNDPGTDVIHSIEGITNAVDRARREVNVADTELPIIGPLNVGEEVSGSVTGVQPYGVFVKLVRNIDGLLHVSQFPKAENGTPRVYRLGEAVRVRLEKIDDRGKVAVSWVRDLS